MELEKGDIVAVYGKINLISLSIEFITRSPISHVALVVDSKKKELIEANMNRKIGYRLLDDYKHHCVILRVPSLTDSQKDKIVEYAKNQIGDSYDFKALIEEFLRYTFNLNTLQPEDEKRFICSTLVNASYLNAGVKLTDQYLPSPRDIMKSPLVALVGHY
ncbi:YiiX/YebB-like N1pC/P60 family cysteine hydrolase [Bacillus cereus]|uniref:YiiX/YebB-like N1pC/P60 family cysteine hydrolase n=1 Tax=Bacillus cereus TaxID=1396 RepID=UPI000BF9E269|nr:YiiX/YebB-like N1pC/P60 family cysteine hydrolase [Bacillus cereus]NKX13326.1 hypothetical protein [Bacillus cereus]PFL41851.1 hypothetical protein COJ06_06265 [Bacillus cereus]PGQ70005.1 hypothetical protein COA27_17870 [Bacillus cereus]